MRKYFKIAVILPTLIYSSLPSAGGPLVVEGSDDNTPVTYSNPTIVVNIENGKLGSRSNAQADDLVRQALDLWNTIDTATIDLIVDETEINLDVNQDNFDVYLPAKNQAVFNDTDNLNPVVYDDGGEIIDAYFGSQQSDLTIGFAASIYRAGANNFSEGYVVINGRSLGLSDTELMLLVAHEIGHFIGLDHSQADISNQEGQGFNAFCSDTRSPDPYPVMYPFACRNVNSLHADDISALTALYPVNLAPNADFSVLSGYLTDQSGDAILGANIWAEENNGKIYSIVSDYLKQGTGFFQLLLPAGNYTLHVNSINLEFNDGSSVGPYALSTSDLSFTCANGIAPTAYEGNTPGSIEVISVPPNQSTFIDFRLHEIDIADCAIAPLPKQASAKKSSGAFSIGSLVILFVLLVACRTRFCSVTRPLLITVHHTRWSSPTSRRC